jgi:hypothetical protein
VTQRNEFSVMAGSRGAAGAAGAAARLWQANSTAAHANGTFAALACQECETPDAEDAAEWPIVI